MWLNITVLFLVYFLFNSSVKQQNEQKIVGVTVEWWAKAIPSLGPS